jgi:putative protein-disulfide isomerase
MSVAQSVLITYAFDAYCGWCFGFSTALHRFAGTNSDRIRFRVLSGGLFIGDGVRPIGTYTHIPAAKRRIEELTGVTFGDGFNRALAEGAMVLDSLDAAAGLVALRQQDPNRTLDASAAMLRAWHLDGRSLSDPAVYRDIAVELGLDQEAVAEAFADPATRIEAEGDFREVRRLGVDSYPTLLVHAADAPRRLGGPVSPADILTRELDALLAANAA